MAIGGSIASIAIFARGDILNTRKAPQTRLRPRADTLGVVYGYCRVVGTGEEGAVGTSRPHAAPYTRPSRSPFAIDATAGVGRGLSK